mgnify:CR=1 FL=1
MIDLKNEPKKLKEAAKKVFDEVNAELKELGATQWAERKLTQQEGGNGHYVGEIVTLTGEIGMADVVDNATGKITAKYPAVKLTTGAWFSLKHLIRPNLTGYQTKGIFVEDEDGKAELQNGVAVGGKNSRTWEADIAADFDKEDANYLDIPTRNVIELYVLIKEGNVVTEGVQMQFQGTACRPIVAREKSSVPTIPYSKGAHRVMRQQVWTVA